jgi:hypothetical protein
MDNADGGEPTSMPVVPAVPVPCNAWIVSSIGSVGQKCPWWHVDNVPLHLMISLARPGCIYVPIQKEKEMQVEMNNNGNNKNGDSHENIYGVNWDTLNGLEEWDNMLANKIILHNSEENLAVYASEGDVVLLTGRAWDMNMNMKENQIEIMFVIDIL